MQVFSTQLPHKIENRIDFPSFNEMSQNEAADIEKICVVFIIF